MKHLFTLAAIFIIGQTTVQAQLNKGQWLVGGNISFTHQSNNYTSGSYTTDYKSTSFQAAPDAGYFIMKKLAVGLRPGISTSNSTTSGNGAEANYTFSYKDKATSTNYTIAPFVRYYFLPAANKVNILADVSYAYLHTKSHNQTDQVSIVDGQPQISSQTTSGKNHASVYTISAGPSIFINRTVALELLAGYAYQKYKGATTGTNNFLLSAGFQIHLGK